MKKKEEENEEEEAWVEAEAEEWGKRENAGGADSDVTGALGNKGYGAGGTGGETVRFEEGTNRGRWEEGKTRRKKAEEQRE